MVLDQLAHIRGMIIALGLFIENALPLVIEILNGWKFKLACMSKLV